MKDRQRGSHVILIKRAMLPVCRSRNIGNLRRERYGPSFVRQESASTILLRFSKVSKGTGTLTTHSPHLWYSFN